MATSNSRLTGKVAIITGGARGIGEAAVRLFVENGAMVVIADILDEEGKKLAEEMGAHTCAFHHCDVAVESDIEALVAFTVSKWGKLDILYNNAGITCIGQGEDVLNMDMDKFDRIMSTNLRGMALGVKHAAKAMVNAGTRGVIICTGSTTSVMAGMAPVAYTVSKHAILGLVRAAASDLGKYGIRVNCVSPAPVTTPLLLEHFRHASGNQNVSMEDARAWCDSFSNLKGHSLTPLDVAMSALYLASDDSSFVSGLNLIVDGGFTITSHIFEK
ncbi:hypothetical protein KP509_17G054400 [Ceratopteris richardii]|uniref:Uncharacterized protein n=2 Tax=Ceratopteris richardii TaxID=49495 RepID=A0A8T2SZL0_CERRI|nr:hypothetical protein KP509_17G054400 [Ceratopteris richardii]